MSVPVKKYPACSEQENALPHSMVPISVVRTSCANLPTRFGDFTLHIFTDMTGIEHMAVVKDTPQNDCLVRLHSECATGDILGSLRCDCRDQLEATLTQIGREPSGILVYIRGHEGRGIGLGNKIRAYALQDQGFDTVEANVHLGFPADARDYTAACAIIRSFNLERVRVLTNNPEKARALTDNGITVTACVPLWTAINGHNATYLATKKDKMGHVG